MEPAGTDARLHGQVAVTLSLTLVLRDAERRSTSLLPCGSQGARREAHEPDHHPYHGAETGRPILRSSQSPRAENPATEATSGLEVADVSAFPRYRRVPRGGPRTARTSVRWRDAARQDPRAPAPERGVLQPPWFMVLEPVVPAAAASGAPYSTGVSIPLLRSPLKRARRCAWRTPAT